MKTLFGLALFTATLSPAISLADFDAAERVPTVINPEIAFTMTCQEIRTYCYDMWMIRRNNYPQYVGCVYSNAENNGLDCQP